MINDKPRDEIQKISDNLSSISDNYKYSSQYNQKANRLLKNSDVNWIFNSGKRIICGISRTLNGNHITENFIPCVVKFETHTDNWNPKKNHNQREIEIWNKASNSNDEKYLGEILDHSVNGQWLIMKEYVPVFESHIKNIKNHKILNDINDYLIRENNFICKFRSKINKCGLYPYDLKGGNIGYDSEKDTYVLIDYGSSIKYDNI